MSYELIAPGTRIDFVRWCPFNLAFSTLLMVASIALLFWQGLNFGIDFAGGVMLQVRFSQSVPLHEVRVALSGLHLGDTVIQEFGASGKEIMIRVKQTTEGEKQSVLSERIMGSLRTLVSKGGEVELRRVEFVGPQVGQELTQQGILAVVYSLAAIGLYVAWRFEWRFAMGAMLATTHDVFIVLGFLSLFQREFTLVVVAAILTVIGFSVNDTVVVFDRIREEMKRMRRHSMGEVINQSINATLSRTVITASTVAMGCIALLLVGGEVTYDFALVMLLGVVSGTYSSVYVASPFMLYLERKGETVEAP